MHAAQKQGFFDSPVDHRPPCSAVTFILCVSILALNARHQSLVPAVSVSSSDTPNWATLCLAFIHKQRDIRRQNRPRRMSSVMLTVAIVW